MVAAVTVLGGIGQHMSIEAVGVMRAGVTSKWCDDGIRPLQAENALPAEIGLGRGPELAASPLPQWRRLKTDEALRTFRRGCVCYERTPHGPPLRNGAFTSPLREVNWYN